MNSNICFCLHSLNVCIFLCLSRKPVQSFIDQVTSITADDIHKIAAKMLATPLTLASLGDGMNLLLVKCVFPSVLPVPEF